MGRLEVPVNKQEKLSASVAPNETGVSISVSCSVHGERARYDVPLSDLQDWLDSGRKLAQAGIISAEEVAAVEEALTKAGILNPAN